MSTPLLNDPLAYYGRENSSDLASELAEQAGLPRELRSKYTGPSGVEIWQRHNRERVEQTAEDWVLDEGGLRRVSNG